MKKIGLTIVCCSAFGLSGCASTYSNLVSGSGLGAAEYRPAVLVNTGMQGKYEEILGICRQVAVNRQITAAQEAQLKTITGVTQGAASGASFGLQMGSMMKQIGAPDASLNKSMAVGAVAGMLSSAGQAFASGTENNAAQTKQILLACLRNADPKRDFYKVLE